MSRPHRRPRLRLVTGGALAALRFVTGCTSNTPESEGSSGDSSAKAAASAARSS